MRRPLAAFTFALLTVFLLTAPAGAITNGQPDGDAHPYVGIIFNDTSFCSGTLLSPTVFLTAGHCTAGFAEEGSLVYVSFDPNPSFDLTNPDETYYAVAELYTDPNFVFTGGPSITDVDANDIGVAILAEPVFMDTYGSLPTEGLVDTLRLSRQTFIAVGYGVRDYDVGGGPPRPGARADRFFAPLRVISADNTVTHDMFLHLSANRGQGRGGTCFGDSGGPIFLGDTTTIVAINSFSLTVGQCHATTYAQRLDTAEALAFVSQFL
jgi:hypothetical protein